MRANRALTVLAAASAAAGCATAAPHAAPPGHSPRPSASTSPTAHVLGMSATAGAAPCGRTTSAAYRHVIWIWMENRSYSQVLGPNGQATHLKSYARRCAVATNYVAIRHPSLPNYLAAVSGSTGGVTTDCSPGTCLQRRASIFGQIQRHGRQWRGYAENMQSRCDRASYDGYAARHNPAVYFAPVHDRCLHWDLRMGGRSGAFGSALQQDKLPAFSFVTPNLCDDGHDCTTTTADRWLGIWLNRIAASPAYAAGRTVVFVTWDEGLDGSDNRVATVVMGPSVTPGTRSSTRFSHYSLLRTTELLLALPALGH